MESGELQVAKVTNLWQEFFRDIVPGDAGPLLPNQDRFRDFAQHLLMEAVYPGFYKTLSKTSHLHVEDTCIGCGLCAKNCPVNAIEMKAGKTRILPQIGFPLSTKALFHAIIPA